MVSVIFYVCCLRQVKQYSNNIQSLYNNPWSASHINCVKLTIIFNKLKCSKSRYFIYLYRLAEVIYLIIQNHHTIVLTRPHFSMQQKFINSIRELLISNWINACYQNSTHEEIKISYLLSCTFSREHILHNAFHFLSIKNIATWWSLFSLS